MHSVLGNQIQGHSWTFIHRFKDFQGPSPFSRNFKANPSRTVYIVCRNAHKKLIEGTLDHELKL